MISSIVHFESVLQCIIKENHSSITWLYIINNIDHCYNYVKMHEKIHMKSGLFMLSVSVYVSTSALSN